jgi:hypothetical protein
VLSSRSLLAFEVAGQSAKVVLQAPLEQRTGVSTEQVIRAGGVEPGGLH